MIEKRITLIPTPLRSGVELAESQVLKALAKFSSELGFTPQYLYLPSSRKSFPQWLSRNGTFHINNIKKMLQELQGEFLLLPYPTSFWLGKSKLSVLFRNTLKEIIKSIAENFTHVIIYVSDLPIEQNAYTRPWTRSTLIDSTSYLIEENIFELADRILVPNEATEKIIRERYYISRRKFVHFEILDLDVNFEPPIKMTTTGTKNIFYVGNLARGRLQGLENHLDKIPSNIKLSLIGPNGEWLKKQPNVYLYIGTLPTSYLYNLISNRGDFGLVWHSLNASYYFKFFPSTKFSTYIIAGLPVLVDRHSKSTSEIVKKYKVGITAENLEKLLLKASNISEEEYMKMRENAISLGSKIKRGYFIKKALKKTIGEVVEPL